MAATTLVQVGAGAPAWSQKLPTGGSVAAGNVTIVQPNATTLNINQTTSQAIINWNSFSVGRGNTVNFNQPNASSSTLDRVTGSTPSWIAGTINAPGTVLLVNPNGIEISKSGVINAGSFAASTLDIKDSDYLSGHYSFNGNGGSAGVINNGHINVSDGGFAALLGGQVSNNGIISARLGTVALGAGEQATIDLSGDGFLSVAVPSSQLGHMVNANGALVSNKGQINANGGTVFLSAATAANILRNAVNIPGSIRTNSVGSHNGRIVINGGGGNVNISGRLAANGGKRHNGGSIAVSGQNVSVTGKLEANGKNGGSVSVASSGDLWISGTAAVRGVAGSGGLVDLAGSTITLAGAAIDASGSAGGGTINIGGGPHATVALADAQSVSVDAATVIRADATDNGNGGHVVIWSAGQTMVSGTLSAMGGPNGGNGGSIETSGEVLNVAGITVNASAANGRDGNWLLDPVDLIIDSTLAGEIDATLNGGTGVTLLTSATGNPTTPYTLTAGEMNLSGHGDIDVDATISWSSSASLTLSAYRNISVGNISIKSTGGGNITLYADNTGTGIGTVTFAKGDKVSTLGVVTIFYDPSGNNNQKVNSTSYTAPTNYSGNVTGGASLTAYMLVNTVYDLQNIQNNLSGTYALGTNIDASSTSSWNGGAGFVPIGSFCNQCIEFTGSLNGAHFAIDNLYINRPSTDYVGLFAAGANAVVQNLTLANVNITGADYVGGLFARIDNANISAVAVSGTVTGQDYVGGLAGEVPTGGKINYSLSTAAVTGTGNGSINNGFVGGLVGDDSAAISQSAATGKVFGYQWVGGLVGYLSNPGSPYAPGSLTDTYATGAVGSPSAQYVGGLVGAADQGTSINTSYSVGQVTGSAYFGGFLGINYGAVTTNSYYNTTTTGLLEAYATGSGSNAGIMGLTTLQMQDLSSYLTNYAGFNFSSIWIPPNQAGQGGLSTANYPQLYALSPVVVVDASSTARSYGAANNPLVIDGSPAVGNYLLGPAGDTVSTSSITAATLSTLATATSNVGTYAITDSIATLTSTDGIVYRVLTIGNLTVNPATLTYVANTNGMTYGGTVPALSGTVTGFVNGQTLSSATAGTLAFNTAANASSNVGSYAITGSGLTANNGNYTFVQAAGNATAFTVSPATLTYVANANGMTYGGTVPGLSGTVTGFVNGQTLSSATTGTLAFNTAANASSNVGSYAITGSGLTANNGNYTFVQAAGNATAFTVSPATLTYVATANSMTYGGTVPGLSGTVTGFVNGQTLASATTGTLAFNTAANASSNVGSYAITGSGLTANNGNYTFVQTAGNATAFTVSPATLTYVATANSMTYGGTVPALSGTVTGFVNGQTLASATTGTLAFNTAANSLSNVGSYAITGSGLTANNGNYTFVQATGNANAFAITPATLTLNGSKTYDSTTAFAGSAFGTSGTISTGIAGQTLTVTGAGSVNSANASPTAQALNTSGLTLANGSNGGLASNYVIASIGNTGTITPEAVTVTASANSKTYDGTTVATATPTPTSGQFYPVDGAVLSETYASPNAGGNILLNPTVAFTPTGNAAGASNYTITYVTATGSIGQATVTLTGTKTYDSTTAFAGSAFGTSGTISTGIAGQTLTVTGTGSVNSANASPTAQALNTSGLTLANGSNGGLASNYVIASSGNTGTITPEAVTVTASANSKTYDGTTVAAATPTPTSGQFYTVDGAVLSETYASPNAGGNILLNPTVAFTPTGNAAGASNYTITYVTATGSIGQATVTLAGTKTYDSTTAFAGSAFGTSGTISTGIAGQTLTVTGTGSVNSANASPTAQALNTSGLTLANGSNGGLASNYVIASIGNTGTITPEAVTITASTNTKTYDSTTSSVNTPRVTTGQLYRVDGPTLSETYTTANVGTGLTLTPSVSFLSPNGATNYAVTYVNNTGTITPATLTYVANANSMTFGGSVPGLTGSVTGFVGRETLASATTGTLAFNTAATSLSPPGSYAITGSGLTANHGNYTFVQAASNATALTITSQSSKPTSQFVANVNGNTPNNNVNINFQSPNTGALVRIGFTAPTTTAGNRTNNDASPGALSPVAAFTRNHGLDFQPISQYDANQYSQFKLPDYDDKDGEATIFTIIARAVAHDHASDFMVDGFWNGTTNDWNGANGNNPVVGKVTYSDGAGHDVLPADSDAFPIVAGKTDFAQLLKNGPVMIGGAPDKTPAGWLLALNLAPDGKGIVCDDTITGKLVEIAYDQTSLTLGGITGIFDPKAKGFVALVDAGSEIPPASAAAVAALQGFVPSTFFAVTVH